MYLLGKLGTAILQVFWIVLGKRYLNLRSFGCGTESLKDGSCCVLPAASYIEGNVVLSAEGCLPG